MAAGQALRGLVGQSMAAKKKRPKLTIINMIDTSAGGSYVIPTGCTAFVGLWGAGQNNLSTTQGGFGCDAVFSKLLLQQGWTLTWAIGTGGSPGGDTTLTWPAGKMLARGGGSTSVNLGQYASAGGAPGTNGNGAAGADGGGAGGLGSGTGGGGGGAGLLSKFPGFTQGGAGGNGVNSQENGIAPGGGAGGDVIGGVGANGRALILILRQASA